MLLDIPETGDMPKGKALDLRQASPIVGFDSPNQATGSEAPSPWRDRLWRT